MAEMTLSSSADGSRVESPLRAIETNEDAEEASIVATLGAARIEHSECNRTEVGLPASVIDRFKTDVLFVDTIADVELDSVNADDTVVMGTLDPEVRRVLELR